MKKGKHSKTSRKAASTPQILKSYNIVKPSNIPASILPFAEISKTDHSGKGSEQPLEEAIDNAINSVEQEFTHDQLLKALYWIWDAFDRALIGCFFVFKTAEDILQNKELEGDGVHVGVRKLEWISGAKTIFDAFVGQPIESSENLIKYDHEGVPVFVHVFEDDPCIRETNTVMYFNEAIQLPNPYSMFMEKYGKWKS